MTRFFISIIVIFYVLFTACQNTSQTENKDLRVIDVAGGVGKNRLVNLSEIAESIEYIPLETNNESVLNSHSRYPIFFVNGIVYFPQREDGSVKIFDSSGKYISTFNRMGRGPQEYENFSLALIDIDNISGNILIKTYNKILEYMPDGKFVRRINIPERELSNINTFLFNKLKDLFVFSVTIYRNSVYSSAIIDSASNVVMKLKYPLEEVDFVQKIPNSFSFINSYIYTYNGSVRLINGNNKYVLNINPDLSVDTAFIINYGKYNVINDRSKKPYKYNSPYLWRKYDFFESSNYLFMQFHVGSLTDKQAILLNPSGPEYIYAYSCSLFNKKTGAFTFLDQPNLYQLGFVEDLEGGPAVWPKDITPDNYMYSFVQAEEFIAHAENHKVSEKFKKIAEGLKETDNPVLVRVKLKN